MDDSITVSQVEKPKFADTKAWARFLQVFTLALGSGLMLAGVIFFFAYNWESLHRLVKLGMAVALILAVFSAVMTVKMKGITRKITVSALCGLVGVFWAIFGQAYQTKADSSCFSSHGLPVSWYGFLSRISIRFGLSLSRLFRRAWYLSWMSVGGLRRCSCSMLWLGLCSLFSLQGFCRIFLHRRPGL